MASARIDKGFKYHVWPENKWNTEPFLFIYLFIYLLDTTLQHLGLKCLFFFLNTEVVLKSGGSLNMLLI